MRAAIFRDGEIVVDQLPEPKPAAEDVQASEPAAATSAPKKPESPSKAALLAKVRDRLKDGGPPGK